jgi:hypothetical protein
MQAEAPPVPVLASAGPEVDPPAPEVDPPAPPVAGVGWVSPLPHPDNTKADANTRDRKQASFVAISENLVCSDINIAVGTLVEWV